MRPRNRYPRVAMMRAEPQRRPAGWVVPALSVGVALGGVAALALAFHLRAYLYAAIDYASWVGAVWVAALS